MDEPVGNRAISSSIGLHSQERVNSNKMAFVHGSAPKKNGARRPDDSYMADKPQVN